MPLKIDAFCNFSPCNCEKNAPSTNITSFSVVSQTLFSLNRIFLFNVDMFGLNKLVKHSTLFPVFEDMLHVSV